MDDRDREDLERDPRQIPSFRGPPQRPQPRPLAQTMPFTPVPRVRAAEAEARAPSPQLLPRRKRRRVARALAVLAGLGAGAALTSMYAVSEDWRAAESRELSPTLDEAWRGAAEDAGPAVAPMGDDKIAQPSVLVPPPVAAAPAPARQAGPAALWREPPVARAVSPDVAAVAVARGDELMRLRDVASARRFYELAASSGLPQAARAVAQTYDPKYLERLGVAGFPGDAQQAARWYDRASELAGRGPTPLPSNGSTTEASPR